MSKNADTVNRAEQLGRILRRIRMEKKWSLKDFERACGGEIKDVVLGSYERATRSVSVTNLEIIANTYQIPMSALFDENKEFNHSGIQGRVILDLRKIRDSMATSNSEALSLLHQFTKSIVTMRMDWNGEILSLRTSDAAFLSIIFANKDIEMQNFLITKDSDRHG